MQKKRFLHGKSFELFLCITSISIMKIRKIDITHSSEVYFCYLSEEYVHTFISFFLKIMICIIFNVPAQRSRTRNMSYSKTITNI